MARETVERITRREASARLDLGDLGLEQHYLWPSGYRADVCLSNARRSAVLILRPPIAASFGRALGKPLEISRLLRTVDRVPPLSAFVAGCMEVSCVIAYTAFGRGGHSPARSSATVSPDATVPVEGHRAFEGNVRRSG
jgi:hypothetical protein